MDMAGESPIDPCVLASVRGVVLQWDTLGKPFYLQKSEFMKKNEEEKPKIKTPTIPLADVLRCSLPKGSAHHPLGQGSAGQAGELIPSPATYTKGS